MNNRKKIIIVGTSHALQCGKEKHHTKEQIEDFKLFVRNLIEKENIKCIAEEMNDTGLSEYEVKNTIPFKIADELSILHRYIDLKEEQLVDLCICRDQIDMYADIIINRSIFQELRDLLTDKLLHPIRERFWLARILNINKWPTLLICGADHGDNMRDLINSIGYGPVLSWHRKCPEEIRKN